MEQEYVKDDKVTVGQYVQNTAKELGAQVKVTGFVRYERGEGLEKRERTLQKRSQRWSTAD